MAKLCPIMSMMLPTDCAEDKCAWWDERVNACREHSPIVHYQVDEEFLRDFFKMKKKD